MCDQAWYKDYEVGTRCNGNDNYIITFVNDLLGQRIPITEQQYQDFKNYNYTE